MNTNALRNFIGLAQLRAIESGARGEEGEFFKTRVAELATLIETMPRVYETEGQGNNAVVKLHYFGSFGDWYIIERDNSAEQHQAFGLADLGHGGELGYISIAELIRLGVELDLHWTPRTLANVRAKAAA